MTSSDAHTLYGGDLVLKRVETGLQWAIGVFVVPAALASQAHLSFAPWAILPLLVSMALWLAVTLLIAAGQRLGFVGTKLFRTTPPAVDDVFDAPKREAAPVVRKADDRLPVAAEAVTDRVRTRVVHIPCRGNLRYRIGSAP